MLKLAIRNLTRHGVRTGLTLAAIALGVACLVLAGGFVQDVYVQLGEATIHSQLGHLQVYRKGFYAQGMRSPFRYTLPEPTQLSKIVERNPLVKETMLRVAFSGLLNNGRADFPIEGEGVEPAKEARLGTFVSILQGRLLGADDRFGVLVGEGVAKSLHLGTGSRVTMLSTTAEGALNSVDLEVVGIFRSFSKDYDNHAVRVPLSVAHELLVDDVVNSLVVVLAETSNTARAKLEIERALSGRNVEVRTWEDLSDFYGKTIELYKRQFGVLELITLIMVVLSVTSSVSMTTFERVGEFGTMRALGDRQMTIFRLVMLESAVTGLTGAIIGAAVGITLAMLISFLGIPMPPPPNAESGYTAIIRIVPSNIAVAFGIGFIATLLAALWPARRISQVPLSEALRENV